MPFEMIVGRRGRVLVASIPVIRGSYVSVETRRLQLRLMHPEGVIINKWPAIVPEFPSLSERTRETIDALREEELARLVEQFRRTTGNEPSLERFNEMKRWICRPMTCVDVAPGKPLIASLPPKPFKQRGRFDFGTITAITIHNKGEAPVSVES